MRASRRASFAPIPPILQEEVEQQTEKLREALAYNDPSLLTSMSITSHGQENARTICRLRMTLPDGLTLGCEGQGSDASIAIRQAFTRMTRHAALCLSWMKRRAQQRLTDMDTSTR
jgi:hypothetical protein